MYENPVCWMAHLPSVVSVYGLLLIGKIVLGDHQALVEYGTTIVFSFPETLHDGFRVQRSTSLLHPYGAL